jgi:hypothetical protein
MLNEYIRKRCRLIDWGVQYLVNPKIQRLSQKLLDGGL